MCVEAGGIAVDVDLVVSGSGSGCLLIVSWDGQNTPSRIPPHT